MGRPQTPRAGVGGRELLNEGEGGAGEGLARGENSGHRAKGAGEVGPDPGAEAVRWGEKMRRGGRSLGVGRRRAGRVNVKVAQIAYTQSRRSNGARMRSMSTTERNESAASDGGPRHRQRGSILGEFLERERFGPAYRFPKRGPVNLECRACGAVLRKKQASPSEQKEWLHSCPSHRVSWSQDRDTQHSLNSSVGKAPVQHHLEQSTRHSSRRRKGKRRGRWPSDPTEPLHEDLRTEIDKRGIDWWRD